MKLTQGYKSILKNATFFYASLFLNQILRIIYIIFLARYLGPDLYGLWSYGQSWYLSFLPLIMFGLGPILVKSISQDHKSGTEIANLIFSIRLILIVLVSFICVLFGFFIADSSQVALLLIILSFALIGRAIGVWGDQMFQAYEVAKLSFSQEKLFRTSEIIFGIGIAYYTQDIILVALSHAIIWLAQGIRAVYLVQAKLQKIQLYWQWSKMLKILQQSFPIGLAIFFHGLNIQGAIILYKQSGVANEMIGNLAIVVQALMIIGSIFLSIEKAALPVLTRSIERNDAKDQYYLDVMLRIAFIFGTIVGLCGLTFGSDIIVLFVGSKYQAAMEYLGLMLWVLIPYTIRQSINTLLIVHGYYWKSLFIESIGLVSMVTTVLYLINVFEFQGVIIGILFAFSISAFIGIINVVQLKLIDNVHVFLKLIMMTMSTIFLFYLLVDYNRWISLLVSVLFLFISVYFLKLINQSEMQKLKSLRN